MTKVKCQQIYILDIFKLQIISLLARTYMWVVIGRQTIFCDVHTVQPNRKASNDKTEIELYAS